MIRANVSGAISRLGRLSAGLRRVADGEAATAAAEQLAAEVLEDARAALSGHVRSGHAEDVLAVTSSASGVELSAAGYLRFHPGWWPFAEGLSAYTARAVALYREQVQRLLAS